MNEDTLDVMFSSANSNWQTPEEILDIVEDVFDPHGGIWLDPASPGKDRTLVHAHQYFTQAEDGLTQQWYADTTYLNPPYGTSIGDWTGKLRAEFNANRTKEFIALLPARPDTRWWRNLISSSMRVCFLHKRVRYLNEAGYEQDPAPFPSCLVWGGSDPKRFEALVYEHGSTYRLSRGS